MKCLREALYVSRCKVTPGACGGWHFMAFGGITRHKNGEKAQSGMMSGFAALCGAEKAAQKKVGAKARPGSGR